MGNQIKTKRPEGTVERKPLTAEQRKAYAKECTKLATEHKIPFELVLLFKKDVERAKTVIEVCSKIEELSETDRKDIEAGGAKRVAAFKRLSIPFKGVNVDKLDILSYIK